MTSRTEQEWATLFCSWATLETKFVPAGQYKYHILYGHIYLFDFTFLEKWAFYSPFLKRNNLRGIFIILSTKKLSGHIWGRTFPRPTLEGRVRVFPSLSVTTEGGRIPNCP